MTCCICFVTGAPLVNENWNVSVRRTARGGPIGDTPSGAGWLPSQSENQFSPSEKLEGHGGHFVREEHGLWGRGVHIDLIGGVHVPVRYPRPLAATVRSPARTSK